jgi:threonine aldolase
MILGKEKKSLIDLRSDTVTLPTEEMYEAIKNAKLGDDVYKEDPTVNKLEELAAKKMGKEDALLVSSGTMANLVSILTNSQRGESAILESKSHIYMCERGGISAIAGILPLPVQGEMGFMKLEDLNKAYNSGNLHSAKTTLLCLENTHNRSGGTVITPFKIKTTAKFAYENNLILYMDGARVFNAAVALGVDVKNFTRHVDNMMFCLSKGLSCPIGSIIVGTQLFIEDARKNRKILGGGMRQAGLIAAPGIVALETMVDRLEFDHKNACLLAKTINQIDGIRIDLKTVQTNIVICDISGLSVDSAFFIEKLKKEKILTLSLDKNRVRFVTHYGINREDIEKTCYAIEKTAREIRNSKHL